GCRERHADPGPGRRARCDDQPADGRGRALYARHAGDGDDRAICLRNADQTLSRRRGEGSRGSAQTILRMNARTESAISGRSSASAILAWMKPALSPQSWRVPSKVRAWKGWRPISL